MLSSSEEVPASTAPPLLVRPIAAYLPFYNRQYHNSATKAFNLVRFAVQAFRADVTVFATAMVYWHEFAGRHGCKRIDEAVLAGACVFLALKVEHYRVRADQIVKTVFEVDRDAKADEFLAWRQTLLEVELVLSDTLHFDFQRTHALARLLSWVEEYDAKPANMRSGDDAIVVGKLKQIANSLYTFALITPIFTRASPDEVAATILFFLAVHSGSEEAYAHVWKRHPPPEASERDGILGVLLDAFAFLKKHTGLVRLDEQIKMRRKRSRGDTTSDSARSAMVPSSSNGSASYDASPCMRTLDS